MDDDGLVGGGGPYLHRLTDTDTNTETFPFRRCTAQLTYDLESPIYSYILGKLDAGQTTYCARNERG